MLCRNLHTVRCRSHMACDAARAFIPGEMVHGYRVNKVMYFLIIFCNGSVFLC